MEEFRASIELNIKASFQGINLNFVGWGPCYDDQIDLRLFTYDDQSYSVGSDFVKLKEELAGLFEYPGHPALSFIGPRIPDRPSKMFVTLNSTMEDAYPSVVEIYAGLTEQGKENLVISAAIHEFGHVLGLKHEDAHPDSTCVEYDEPMRNAIVVSAYNPFSFMSRCYYRNFNYNLGIVSPNAMDLIAMQKMYPTP
jgi:hypothetical protein